MQACVSLPYVLALGTFSFNLTLKSVGVWGGGRNDPNIVCTYEFKKKSVDCFDCKLYTCVNNSLSINWSSQALLILRSRRDVDQKGLSNGSFLL
jgi:hypothetical protein